MTPEITTNAQSYERPEGHITGANKEQEKDRSSGESLSDWIRRHEIPQLRSMDGVYRIVAQRLKVGEANPPLSDVSTEEDLFSFDALPDLDALAEAQGVSPTTDINDLATDDWPEDESVEDFIAAAMEGRHEEDEPDS